MQKSFFFFSLIAVVALLVPVTIGNPPLIQEPAPRISLVQSKPAAIHEVVLNEAVAETMARMPVRLSIPSIALDVSIQRVGLNERGEMDVPDGRTSNVGWYQDGTLPGEVGSAVLDAHVYAAFENLHKAALGADVYVTMSDGEKIHFVVEESKAYPLADVPRETLFNRADNERLNLITCEGTFDYAQDTYDHRRIVFARLVGAEPAHPERE